jgi:hypothetical protein
MLLLMKLPFTVLIFLGTSILSYSQEQTITLENGVVVHQAVGMEGNVQNQTFPTTPARSVNEWNLAECLETLTIIDEKCQQISVEECNAYGPLILSIQQRIEVLNQDSE